MKKMTTVFFLILTLILAYLGLYCMNKMLTAAQDRALSRSGSIPMAGADTENASGILKWNSEEDEAEKETAKNDTIATGSAAIGTVMVIADEDITDIVEQMERSSNMFLHEPYNSQLTMDEAVSAGNDWLDRIYRLCGEYYGVLEASDYEMVSAKLYGPDTVFDSSELSLPIEFYSFWDIHYKMKGHNQEELFLHLNAATGKVLYVSIYSSLMDFTGYSKDALNLYLMAYAECAGLNTENFSGKSYGLSTEHEPYEILSLDNEELFLVLETYTLPSINLSIMNMYFSTNPELYSRNTMSTPGEE